MKETECVVEHINKLFGFNLQRDDNPRLLVLLAKKQKVEFPIFLLTSIANVEKMRTFYVVALHSLHASKIIAQVVCMQFYTTFSFFLFDFTWFSCLLHNSVQCMTLTYVYMHIYNL
uniref:Predicted protein n=1 Tax=Hordeum vulgare subsp. vulgare TaxID=112509 RepID=F2E7W5_HORVV|nr:predicted protein [Hordeum vulgare subsp. vulgare]